MPGNKTQPTDLPVTEHIAALNDPRKRVDSIELIALMNRLTGADAKMWGPSIIGFGSYRYRYESGREGVSFLAGFAPRKREMVVYLNGQIPDQAEWLKKLGPHRMGKGCLYVKRLDDIDREVLTELIVRSIAALEAKYPDARR